MSDANLVEPTESVLVQSVLSGGGEMSALMRAFDWSHTPLGPLSQWPQSLRIAVRILLGTGYPMLICWGSEYTMIYNDGYRPILGKTKHPAALGSPIGKVFTEAMDFIGPRFDNVMARGEDFTVTDQLFILDRNDYLEECYFTFSYSPAPAEDGGVGGVLVTALETTERVLDDRRRRTLRDLATEMAKTHTEQDVWHAAATTLVSEPLTVPFAALYSYHSAERRARLVASGGGINTAMCPPFVDCESVGVWPFRDVLTSSAELTLDDLEERFADVPLTSWGVPPLKAVILPILLRGHRDPAGFLVAGISPRREFDEPNRQFLHLSAEQIATGLTSARAYEEERRRAEELAELDRAKTLFFSNVSHEFRTPLTLILGPLEELATKGASRLDPEDHQQVEVARRSALRLLKLVNTLLDFSRIEAGRVQAAYEPTDLGAFTAEIASVFRSAMEKAGLRFSVECEPLDEPVYVDREMWEKIVLNLLSNAFKFTFDGEVTVSLKSIDGSIEFAVRDTGIGIAEEEQARVFERFHRIENARARTHEGTGIGLSLVHELTKLHGGDLRLESAQGRGSTFTVRIPCGVAHLPMDRIGVRRTQASTALSADAYLDEAQQCLPREAGGMANRLSAAVPTTSAASAMEEGDTTKDLIVIADDNADMRDYLAHLLSEHYRVHAVSGGQQAVEAARKLNPALVLADVMMPGLDGFGMLNAIRAEESLKGTPVILLSARAGEESRVEGLEAGADDYLVKPFTARELIARVSAHVKMAKLRREAAEHEALLRDEAERDRQRLQELLAQAPAAIGLMHGPEHRWVYVNENYVQLTGRRSPTDFIGKTLIESLPELETQVFVKLLDEVHGTGKPYVGREMKAVLNRSGSGLPDESFWDFVYQPVRNADGATEGILVHAVEVTDKVLARNTITEAAERLSLAQAAAQIGTWEWDPVRDYRSLSPELHRLFGTEADDSQHANKWAERVHAEDWSKVERCMAEGHRSGEMDFEYRYSHPELGLRWFYCKGRRFKDETRMLGIVQDITNRKNAEELLHESELWLAGQKQAFQAAVDGAPLSESLDVLIRTAVKQFRSEARCAFYIANAAGTEMKHVVGMPRDYARCVDGFKIGPDSLACGLAVHTGEPRITPDVCDDPLWKPWLQLAEQYEYRGCWSFPVKASSGTTIGTFAMYFRKPRQATSRDLEFANMLTHAAAIIISKNQEAEERARAERVLRDNEQRLSLAQQAAGIGTFEWDLRTNENLWTPELEAMYGLAPGSFGRTQEDWERLVHPEDRPNALRQVDLAFQTGAPVQAEWRTVWADGSTHWILGRWQVFKDESGAPARMAGINIDITGRKTAEEARRHLAAIVESSDDAIASKDLNGIVTSWNRQAERLFGYSSQEMIGQPIRKIIPPELQDDEDRILATIAKGEAIEHFETVRIAKSGKRIDVALTISPIRDENGRIVGASKIVRNITQRKQTEQALRMTERLASVGRLAATMAHEINNPLEAVTNLLYLARSADDPKQIHSLLAQVDEELNRVALLSKQSLGFYRERNSAKLLRIGSIIESLVAVFTPKARNRLIEIRLEIRQDPEIYAIEGEIRQVVANLLSNSVDAISGGGTIRVRVSAGSAWDQASRSGVRLTIADSGCGIAPEHRPKLFDPFFTANKDVGTGLGLWVSKGIVERHGGSIRFKSRNIAGNSGAVFTVFLPTDSAPRLMES
jgi:PAS domain S-box-containing protein